MPRIMLSVAVLAFVVPGALPARAPEASDSAEGIAPSTHVAIHRARL